MDPPDDVEAFLVFAGKAAGVLPAGGGYPKQVELLQPAGCPGTLIGVPAVAPLGNNTTRQVPACSRDDTPPVGGVVLWLDVGAGTVDGGMGERPWFIGEPYMLVEGMDQTRFAQPLSPQ